jgi:hypothetical protein
VPSTQEALPTYNVMTAFQAMESVINKVIRMVLASPVEAIVSNVGILKDRIIIVDPIFN